MPKIGHLLWASIGKGWTTNYGIIFDKKTSFLGFFAVSPRIESEENVLRLIKYFQDFQSNDKDGCMADGLEMANKFLLLIRKQDIDRQAVINLMMEMEKRKNYGTGFYELKMAVKIWARTRNIL